MVIISMAVEKIVIEAAKAFLRERTLLRAARATSATILERNSLETSGWLGISKQRHNNTRWEEIAHTISTNRFQ